jgi:hypothetical protein
MGALDIGALGVKRSIGRATIGDYAFRARALISTNPDRSPSRSPEHVRRVPKVAGLERF